MTISCSDALYITAFCGKIETRIGDITHLLNRYACEILRNYNAEFHHNHLNY